MRFKLYVAIIVTMLGIIPATAQFGNPGGADPATRESAPGVPLPNQTNTQDRLFASLATQGGTAEVEIAKLALQKTRNESVSAFARQMLEEHGKSNARLAQLTKQMGIPLPADLAPDQKALEQNLSVLEQGQFE